jgi:hypothetical protein
MRRIAMLAAAAALTAVAATSIPASGAPQGDEIHRHGDRGSGHHSRELAKQIAKARVALAPYANNLAAAQAAGYEMQITPMMKDMGYHYMNPDVQGFDVSRPPILVYVGRGEQAQLVAAEWVFPRKPAKPPLPGATYGSFAAACHYEDGTFVPQRFESKCAPSTAGGSPFTFWHPDLVTLHLWAWYPNPEGVFNGTNPFVAPFNTQ